MKKLIISLSAIIFLAISAKAQENPIANISQQPGWCTIIHRWGFIGDSLCSGEHEYKRADGTTVWDDIYEYSWGQYIARKNGLLAYNFSRGGMTAKEYVESFYKRLSK